MTVKSLENFKLNTNLNPCKNKACQACGLYVNQMPIFDKVEKSHIFWVGLSAVKFDDDIQKEPLSPATRSGALIETIEKPLRKTYSFYKTNIVKCVPLREGKIRYPLRHEMEKCYPKFENELKVLNPSIVFLLGKQVASFIIKKHLNQNVTLDSNFNYQFHLINNIKFVPIHHPSYILVYKRKFINQYIQGLRKICKEAEIPFEQELIC